MKGLMMQYALTTTSILEYGNRVFPYKEIISYLPNKSRHACTYADLYKRCKQLSKVLVERFNIQKGDIIGTFAWNHYQHLELYYAIPGAGAVCHTINLRLPPQQIEYIINNSEDRLIFIDATLVPLIEKIAPLLSTVECFIIINAPQNFSTTLNNVAHYEDLLVNASDDFEWIDVDEEDACAMCYTSGTTGQPKGVLYSHRSTYLHALGIILPNAGNISANDRVLLIVPQFHVMAWGTPYALVMTGAVVIMPSMFLQPEALIKILIDEKVNKSNGVPTIWLGIYDALKKNPPAEKLSLTDILVGGSAVPESLMDNLKKDFDINIIHAWGMTETSPLGTVSRLQQQHEKLSTAEQLKIKCKQGFELPGIELRCVKEDGTVAPRDGVTAGEFEARGAWVIDGYYKVNNRDDFSADGWFKTGDVGTIDKEGYMQITDRTKDLIKSGGEWISSVALEVAIMAHPKIKEASVIAIPDAKWAERPLAVVVLHDENDTVSTEDLRTLLLTNFLSYQLPDSFVFAKEIPKTSVGKFDKKEMRKLYAEGKLGGG
jgi:fatty-acyl-CoA synthase